MSDELQRLHATLTEIDRLLSCGQSADELRGLVAQALADIDAAAAESGRQAAAGTGAGHVPSGESLVKRLAEGAREFEDSHPTLFGSVGSVIDALSRMGI